MSGPLSPEDLEARLRRIGAERYHHRHPFNLRMHAGKLSPEEIRTWVRNRYYYQTRIPIKDGLILAKAQDPRFRREWIRRIRDHDGEVEGTGGLALWLGLAEAVGLDVAAVERLEDERARAVSHKTAVSAPLQASMQCPVPAAESPVAQR